jgi:hypothetical protein
MLRIFLAALLVGAALVTVKRERLLERAHISGSCTTYAYSVDGTEWRKCSSGRISGAPNLKLNGCTDVGPRGNAELWRCPARLASNTSRQ